MTKLLGELVWHGHDAEDEMFLVPYVSCVSSSRAAARCGSRRGSPSLVPRGVLHKPVADDQVGIVLIETVTTAHTGAAVIDLHRANRAPGRLRLGPA